MPHIDEPDQQLREAMAALCDQMIAAGVAPPDPDELLAFHRGELPDEERSAVLDRLVCYPSALETLRALDEIDDLEPGPLVDVKAAEAGWQRFREKLHRDEPVQPPERDPNDNVVPFRRRLRFHQGGNLILLAACLTLAFLYVRDQIGVPISTPDDVRERHFELASGTTRGSVLSSVTMTEDLRLTIACGNRVDRLGPVLINIVPKQGGPALYAQTRDFGDSTLFELTIPHDLFVKRGLYRLELYRVVAGTSEPLATLPLKVD